MKKWKECFKCKKAQFCRYTRVYDKASGKRPNRWVCLSCVPEKEKLDLEEIKRTGFSYITIKKS